MSVTGNKRSRQAGLTLIELLVVMVILGVVTGVAIVSAPPRRGDAEVAARTLVADLKTLRMQAITEGRPFGLDVVAGRLVTHVFIDGQWHQSTLAIDLPEGVSVAATLADGFILPEDTSGAPTLVLDGTRVGVDTPVMPMVRIDPTGEATPSQFDLFADGDVQNVTLSGAGVAALADE